MSNRTDTANDSFCVLKAHLCSLQKITLISQKYSFVKLKVKTRIGRSKNDQ